MHRFLKPAPGWLILWAVILAASTTTSTQAISTVNSGPFQVVFHDIGDSDGYLIGEGNWTDVQKQDVSASITAWSSVINNTPGRTLTMHAFWAADLGSRVLGGSSSYRVYDEVSQSQWNIGEYTWKNQDNPENYGISTPFDTVIQYDMGAGDVGYTWNFGAAAPTANQVDFRSVVTHEIGHSLGFDSSYYSGLDTFGVFLTSPTTGIYAGITDWDRNLQDSLGNVPQNGSSGTPGDFLETSGSVYWTGPNATALYGGLVPIYSPTTWQEGSSLVHVDETALVNDIMSPSIGAGEMNRNPSALDLAMMQDMGWAVVPEPGVALIALGSLGWFATRRPRRKAAAPNPETRSPRRRCTRRCRTRVI